jgi:hypothetical protein
MIEKHRYVADSVVERKTIYRVVRHHWPELLVFKNKNESRKINVLIYRTEAVLYGNQFVERLTEQIITSKHLLSMTNLNNKKQTVKHKDLPRPQLEEH